MPRTRAELKAELQVEAERLIEAMLHWTEQTEAPDLTAIEDQVLTLRQQFGEKLAEAAVERQATAAPLTVRCPQCGRPMHQKKKRQRRRVESRVGEIPLKRAYYYCDHCQVGLFPPGLAIAGGGPRVE
ncbi:MAG: hypothetical protein HY872_02570 [Chloroflexi bacterium]|nr:hypothetical protein [Chloroflexota bacterium]